jgi:CheY-like chemotaxis protein
MYERMFRSKGYEIDGVTDGQNALVKLKELKTRPVAIVLDALLPPPGGIDLLRMMKNDDTLKHIPVSVITNSFEKDDEELFLSLGASLVVTRMSNKMDDIIERVNEAIHQHEQLSDIH